MKPQLLYAFLLSILLGATTANAQTDIGKKTKACLNAQKISIWIWPSLNRVRGCDENLIEMTSLMMLEAGVANKRMKDVPLPSVMAGSVIGASVSLTVGAAAARYGLKAAGYTLSWAKYLGSNILDKMVNRIADEKL